MIPAPDIFSSLLQYMTTLRMQQEGQQGESSEEEEDEEDYSEDEEESGEGENVSIERRLQDGTLLPPSAIEPVGRGHGRQSRRTKDAGVPSKGAAAKAAAEGYERGMKERVAAERARKANKEAKHHGKKAHAGKTGRAWTPGAGGKAKTSDKALVFNSMHF